MRRIYSAAASGLAMLLTSGFRSEADTSDPSHLTDIPYNQVINDVGILAADGAMSPHFQYRVGNDDIFTVLYDGKPEQATIDVRQSGTTIAYQALPSTTPGFDIAPQQ